MTAAVSQLARTVLVKFAWAPASVFAGHVIASQWLGLYRLFPSFDVLMHFLGGAAIGYFFAGCLVKAVELSIVGHLPAWLRLAFVCSMTCAAALLWEFAEFISDRYFGTHSQSGLNDTLADMLFGALGGGLIAYAQFLGLVATSVARE